MVKQDRFSLQADTAQSIFADNPWIADAAVSASQRIYTSGLDKRVEFEADRMGTVLAARAGYYAYGLVHTLMTLDDAGSNDEFIGFFLSTHTATAERIDALNVLLERKLQDDPSRTPVSELARLQTGLKYNRGTVSYLPNRQISKLSPE